MKKQAGSQRPEMKSKESKILLLVGLLVVLGTVDLAHSQDLSRLFKMVEVLQTFSSQLLEFSFILGTGAVGLLVFYMEQWNWKSRTVSGFVFLLLCLFCISRSIIYAFGVTSSLYNTVSAAFEIPIETTHRAWCQLILLPMAIFFLGVTFFLRPKNKASSRKSKVNND